MDRNVKDDSGFPMFFIPDDGDGERLAESRLKLIFEGPMVQGLGLVDCQRSHSHVMVQAVLDDVLKGSK